MYETGTEGSCLNHIFVESDELEVEESDCNDERSEQQDVIKI